MVFKLHFEIKWFGLFSFWYAKQNTKIIIVVLRCVMLCVYLFLLFALSQFIPISNLVCYICAEVVRPKSFLRHIEGINIKLYIFSILFKQVCNLLNECIKHHFLYEIYKTNFLDFNCMQFVILNRSWIKWLSSGDCDIK